MHKRIHRSSDEYQEEYQDDPHSHSLKSMRQSGRERNDTDKHMGAARNSLWIFGTFFECLSSNESCPHEKVPFGGTYYCVWPLKDTSADTYRKPPCSCDEERD